MKTVSKILPALILTFLFIGQAFSQEKVLIYNPDANAKAAVDSAVIFAAETGKHVFLQVGGNWCPWCIRFHKFVEEDQSLDSLMKANFVVVKVNFSKENENRPLLASLGYPQRFGFPVFVILDGKGNPIHIQDSGLLEEGKGYSRDKVWNLFRLWSSDAIRLTSEKYKP